MSQEQITTKMSACTPAIPRKARAWPVIVGVFGVVFRRGVRSPAKHERYVSLGVSSSTRTELAGEADRRHASSGRTER
jgi:hypothetical protein